MSASEQGIAVAARHWTHSWRVAWEFAVHALVGMVIFGIIAVPALLLSKVVTMLVEGGGDPVVIAALKVIEYSILWVDVGLFLVHLNVSAYRTVKRL